MIGLLDSVDDLIQLSDKSFKDFLADCGGYDPIACEFTDRHKNSCT